MTLNIIITIIIIIIIINIYQNQKHFLLLSEIQIVPILHLQQGYKMP